MSATTSATAAALQSSVGSGSAAPVPRSLMEYAGRLTVDDLARHETPDDLLVAMGCAIAWAETPLQHNRGFARDLIVVDPDGCWHALRLAVEERARSMAWADGAHARLYLLTWACRTETSMSAPTLVGLIHALAGLDQPVPAWLARVGDKWTKGTFLLAALDLLPASERATVETLLALGDPTLAPNLSRLRHWMANRRVEGDWWAALAAAWQEAAVALWPTLMREERQGVDVLDSRLCEELLTHPRAEWAAVAREVLLEQAFTRAIAAGSLLQAWWETDHPTADSSEGDVEFADILRTITVGVDG